MRKRCLLINLILILSLLLTGCSSQVSDIIPVIDSGSDSSFSIDFIDVGEGDSALVSCDGHYMLIDGGDKLHGETVYNHLVDKGVNHLDILVMSHLHEDHVGGLAKALTFASVIDHTLCNANTCDKEYFNELYDELILDKAMIEIPNVGDTYELGSAEVEVIATGSSDNNNDSLVILITYGKNKFLFTGDMENSMEQELCEKYNNEFEVNLLKVAHHGSKTSSSSRFLYMTMPDYAIISVGEGNRYGFPEDEVLSRFRDLKKSNGCELYRTDKNGTITVTSDGKNIEVTTEKIVN